MQQLGLWVIHLLWRIQFSFIYVPSIYMYFLKYDSKIFLQWVKIQTTYKLKEQFKLYPLLEPLIVSVKTLTLYNRVISPVFNSIKYLKVWPQLFHITREMSVKWSSMSRSYFFDISAHHFLDQIIKRQNSLQGKW